MIYFYKGIGRIGVKREERILAQVLKATSELTTKDIEIVGGITAAEIAEMLAILRSNASNNLNELYRDGEIAKTETRPVRYPAILCISSTNKPANASRSILWRFSILKIILILSVRVLLKVGRFPKSKPSIGR